MIVLKSEDEIRAMRKAGRVVAEAHARLRDLVRPGTTTGELDQAMESFLEDSGAVPAFKGYHGFPASICASVNEEVVHGIPGKRVLHEGDIVGVDIGAVVGGYYGDAARTYPVGEIDDSARTLLDVTEAALWKGIEQAVTGNRLSDISHAVQTYVEQQGFSVVRDFVGHGIGREMHEQPQVPNFGEPGRGVRLKAGMVLALEPMVNVGDYEVQVQSDNWTVVTKDGTLSAHFEHTVAILDQGPEILTLI